MHNSAQIALNKVFLQKIEKTILHESCSNFDSRILYFKKISIPENCHFVLKITTNLSETQIHQILLSR